MSNLALLITGGRGQLGSELAALGAAQRHWFTHAPCAAELDITDRESVWDAVGCLASVARAQGQRPVVVNTAAYTKVDAAEQNQDTAFRVNSTGAELVAQACAKYEVPLLHISTDYVFSGYNSTPYETTDQPNPKTVYGRSKLAGEQAVLASCPDAWVVRSAWIYGAAGHNFVKTILRLARERDELSVVDDQHGSPTWSADLAVGLVALATRVVSDHQPAQRVLHYVNSGATTWFSFAQQVLSVANLDPNRLKPCTSADYPYPTPRPHYSLLSTRAWKEADLPIPRSWQAALSAAFATNAEAFLGRESS